MPVKSKRQARFFGAAYERGEITRAQLHEWVKGVKYKNLPEKISKKKRATKKRSRRRRKHAK